MKGGGKEKSEGEGMKDRGREEVKESIEGRKDGGMEGRG